MSGRWVCLMYHEVPKVAAPEGEGGYFSVSRQRFGTQLDQLTALGLSGTSVETALEEGPINKVALTFDDGHHTHYSQVFAELLQRGMSATFFVTTSWVGKDGYVTWAQLREMADQGMSIQSHTDTHPFLSELPHRAVEEELRRSKLLLDQQLGQDTCTLALPGGDFPRRWHGRQFLECGFQQVATSRWGANLHLPNSRGSVRFVRRYTVRRDTTDDMYERLALGTAARFSRESVRLLTLGKVRAVLGASRYSRIRRLVLSILRGCG